MVDGRTGAGWILVITGAAGRVGSFYRRWLHEGCRRLPAATSS